MQILFNRRSTGHRDRKIRNIQQTLLLKVELSSTLKFSGRSPWYHDYNGQSDYTIKGTRTSPKVDAQLRKPGCCYKVGINRRLQSRISNHNFVASLVAKTRYTHILRLQPTNQHTAVLKYNYITTWCNYLKCIICIIHYTNDVYHNNTHLNDITL